VTLKKVVQDLGIIGFASMLTSVSGIILLPVLTKNLGAYGYGLWAQVGVTVSLSVMVLRLGLPLSIKRLFPGKSMDEVRGDYYSIILLVLTASFIFSVLLFSFPNILAEAIFDGKVIIVRLVAGIIFVSSLDVIFLTVFRAFREMKIVGLINVLTTYSFVALAIILILYGYDLISIILASLAVKGTLSAALFIMLVKKIPFKKPNFSALKEYLSLGLPAMPGGISHLVVDISDKYIIGIFLGATFVGYYSPAYSLGMKIPVFFAGVLSVVLLPSLSDYYEKNDLSLVKQILNLSVKYFLMISVPTFIGVTIVGRPILTLLTTPEIAQESYMILSLIVFAGILIGVYTIFKQTIFLKKRTKLITYYWIAGASLNFVGNLILVPGIGIMGAAITTVASYVLVVILVINFSCKELPLKPDLLSIIKIVLASIFMGVSIYAISLLVWSNVFFLIVLGIILYFSTLYAIGGVGKKEIDYLMRLGK